MDRLVTLALQNAFLTIIMHYSRISVPRSKSYSAASAVLLNELLKGSISVLVALRRIDSDMTASESASPVFSEKPDSQAASTRRTPSKSMMSFIPTALHPSRLRVLITNVFSADCYKLSIPAILYVIQNNLQYVAASNLDVATFQVTYQMKILTTAAFSVLLLRKRLTRGKWLALCLLAFGVAVVQLQSTAAPAVRPVPSQHIKISHGHALRSEIPDLNSIPVMPDPTEDVQPLITPLETTRTMYPLRGFGAVTLACLTSGLAGVYFEFILKSPAPAKPLTGTAVPAPLPDLWIRNTQLSLFSLIPALLPILWSGEGLNPVDKLGAAFSNFNGWALGTVLTQTFGGLVTAVVIRYSDNIM